MSAQDEFTELIDRARQGCQDSIRILVEQYREPVLRVIRKLLDRRLRSKLDPIDVLQSVWRTFVRHESWQKHFDDPGHFIAFLTGIAAHKTMNVNRHFLDTEKALVIRERRIEAAAEAPADGAN
jgi:hypothetical protein